MKEAPVVIDDEDVVMVEPTAVIENNKNHINKTSIITTAEDTIILDDEPSSEPANEIIEAAPTSSEINKDKECTFVKLLKSNTLLSKIVKHCLNMSNNAGMTRVIHKTLLPLYKDVNNTLKMSESFTNILEKTLHNLKCDPNHKFLHIKRLCEELKEGMFKKKVPFVTIATNIKKSRRKCTKNGNKEKFKDYKMAKFKKRNCFKTDIIELDDDDPVITLDVGEDGSDKDDIMIVEDSQSDGCSEQSNKENSEINNENENKIEIEIDIGNEIYIENDRNIDTVTQNKLIEIDVCNQVNKDDGSEEISTLIENKTVTDNGVINKSVHANTNTTQNSIKTDIFKRDKSVLEVKNKNKVTSPDDLLMPHNSVAYTKFNSKFKSAMAIEQLIMEYKTKITLLEEEEVTSNNDNSPYLQCAKYKAKIVTLYKKLCKLMGNGDGDLMKQRVVRLHVVDGHPSGPVKRLERFLNSTIDETGTVPLPDFHDVIRCVQQSNIVDRLGWSKQDIMKEAIALFTQCGHALRKQRQKREYKDLLSLVKNKEIHDYDPADDDPILHRRLEENKLIAKSNEEEVIERFVQLEYLPRTSRLNPRLGNAVKLKPAESSDSDNDFESELQDEAKTKIYFPILYVDRNNEQESSNNCVPTTIQCADHNVHTAKELVGRPTKELVGRPTKELVERPTKELVTNLTPLPTIHSNNVGEITDNTITRDQNVAAKTDGPKIYTDISKLQKIGACNRYVITFNSDNQELPENNCNILKNKEVNKEVNTSETKDVTVNLETEIKREPIDIQSLLDKLGDNYISTIFDIEDPFVVIEISDSSDDDL